MGAGEQARNKVLRKEWRVCCSGHDPACIGRMLTCPSEACKHTCQWSGEAFDRIRYHWQTEARETGRVTVGVQYKVCCLRSQAVGYVGEQGLAGQFAQALIAAAHATRLTAGKQYAGHRFGYPAAHKASSICPALRACLAGSSPIRAISAS